MKSKLEYILYIYVSVITGSNISMTNGMNIQQATVFNPNIGRIGGKIIAPPVADKPAAPLIERLGGKIVAPPVVENPEVREIGRLGGMIVAALPAKIEEPKAETAKTEAPKAETPAVEVVKAETPKTEPVTAEPRLQAAPKAEAQPVRTVFLRAQNAETTSAEKLSIRALRREVQNLTLTENIKVFGSDEDKGKKAIKWYTIPDTTKEI